MGESRDWLISLPEPYRAVLQEIQNPSFHKGFSTVNFYGVRVFDDEDDPEEIEKLKENTGPTTAERVSRLYESKHFQSFVKLLPEVNDETKTHKFCDLISTVVNFSLNAISIYSVTDRRPTSEMVRQIDLLITNLDTVCNIFKDEISNNIGTVSKDIGAIDKERIILGSVLESLYFKAEGAITSNILFKIDDIKPMQKGWSSSRDVWRICNGYRLALREYIKVLNKGPTKMSEAGGMFANFIVEEAYNIFSSREFSPNGQPLLNSSKFFQVRKQAVLAVLEFNGQKHDETAYEHYRKSISRSKRASKS